MVSAYATGRRLALATVAAKDRNEIEAVLEVIGLIDLKGKIVTADALHCNQRLVEATIGKGGDYCIALDCNQGSLPSDARDCLAKVNKKHPAAKTETSGHGRSEMRRRRRRGERAC
jgi:predicted transposase YbfD/YdcC